MLDDGLARRTAQAAGLQVWGTLKVLLEAKSQGLVEKIEPFVTNLSEAGMWVSSEVRQRILALAGESKVKSVPTRRARGRRDSHRQNQLVLALSLFRFGDEFKPTRRR